MEMTLEDGKAQQQLNDLLMQKAKEKQDLENMNGFVLIKKTKFYRTVSGELAEHIASYKGYAILIKQDIKEKIEDTDEAILMKPTLVLLTELKNLKRVNGNIVRKINPTSLHEFEKLSLVQGVIVAVDKGL